MTQKSDFKWQEHKTGVYTGVYLMILIVIAGWLGLGAALVGVGSFLFGYSMVYTNFTEDTGLRLQDVLERFKADYQKEKSTDGKS